MKRAQAAIEFLMTYGWALLIILVAISALAYFGILNADRFLPERCSLPTGLVCLSHKATTSQITLVIQNNLGQDITLNEIEITNPSGGSICSATYTSSSGELNNGDKNTYTISSCDTGSSGKKFKGTVAITFTDEETLQRTRSGELVTQVE
ncbi:hypothetical protein HY493_01320 [Candidatus Woesearchaeota archaeon]|nr:hypothetical protein [Candidatus Woesearchaeota archaeon]